MNLKEKVLRLGWIPLACGSVGILAGAGYSLYQYAFLLGQQRILNAWAVALGDSPPANPNLASLLTFIEIQFALGSIVLLSAFLSRWAHRQNIAGGLEQ